MVMFYALVALCFSSGALAQMAGWGACPEDIETMKDFNIRDMQGRWYEAGRYSSLGGMMLKCVKSDLLHGGGPGIIQMNSTAMLGLTGKMMSIKGIKIRVADAKEPGKLEVQMPKMDVWRPLWILGSDAHNWIVGYSCVDLQLIHLKYVWISTRQQEASDKVMEKALKVMKKQKLNTKWIKLTDQKNCEGDSSSDESSSSEENEDAHILF